MGLEKFIFECHGLCNNGAIFQLVQKCESQYLFQLEKSDDTNKYFQNLMEAKARDPNKTLAKGLEERPCNIKVC